MELIHCCKKEEVEKKLQEKGFYGFEDPNSSQFLHFSTWNSWPFVKKGIEKESSLDQYDAFLVVSSDNPRLDIRFEKGKDGIEYPHIYGPIQAQDIIRFAPLDSFYRINILLNTSMIDESWCKKSISKFLHRGQVVCILALSFFNDTKNMKDWNKQYQEGQGIWYRANTDVFFPFGIQKKDIHWINYFQDSNQEMLNKIANSDVLMLTGGAPDLFMKRIKEKKLLWLLKRYQGVIIGYSAGAMIQLENYHITPDEDYPEFSWQKGLGYLKDIDLEVHYHATAHQKRFIKKAQQEKQLFTIALYEKGGVIFSSEGKRDYFGQVDLFE